MDKILKNNYYQIIDFVCMCNSKDRYYLRQLFSCRAAVVEEQHIRLIAIAKVFRYKLIRYSLVNLYKESGRLMLEYIEKISKDKNILYNWVNNFIDNIEISQLKESLKSFWQYRLRFIEKEDFDIRNIFMGKW